MLCLDFESFLIVTVPSPPCYSQVYEDSPPPLQERFQGGRYCQEKRQEPGENVPLLPSDVEVLSKIHIYIYIYYTFFYPTRLLHTKFSTKLDSRF